MKSLYRFFHNDASGGIVLLVCAVLAMVAANSSLLPAYQAFLGWNIGAAGLAKPVLFWINDLLMAVFFLYAGLEIKREVLAGTLSTPRRALLPVIAAVCGMAVPAFAYLAVTWGQPALQHGWAIPSATDIAFALGVLALASRQIPLSVRVLLLAIAVIDDLGAVIIIALFYTGAIVPWALAAAGAVTACLFALNRLGVTRYWPYFALGLVLWAAMLQSGLHPTLAGVVLALTVPMHDRAHTYSPLEALMHGIRPWAVFFVLPVFAFANAGVSLAGMGWGDALHPVTLGIALGLFLGKQAGIFGSLYLAIKSPYFFMPQGASWLHLYGISLLCGIGFTMALFIGGLAFADEAMAAYVRMGVMGGSVLSALLGYTVLVFASKHPVQDSYE